MKTIIHVGSVWVYRISNGWYQNIRCFPEARDKNGNPDMKHPSVLKYLKEHT